MRLIDAVALQAQMMEMVASGLYGLEDMIDAVIEAPDISPDEVRGVVHCKDCKWCHAGYCEKYDDLIPFGCANKPWEDWFCADGKRREAIKEAQDAD